MCAGPRSVAIWRRWALTAQKKTLHAAEQDRPDVAAARAAWREDQSRLNSHRLVFIYETRIKTNMARTYGRAPLGHRAIGAVPHGHWQTSIFVAALRCDVVTGPCVIDGPINGADVPGLCRAVPRLHLAVGDVVIMDNLGFYKVSPCAPPSSAARACSHTGCPGFECREAPNGEVVRAEATLIWPI